MARPDVNERLRRRNERLQLSKERLRRNRLDRYLLAGEHEIFAERKHWAMLAEPVGSTAAALLAVLVIDYYTPPGLGFLTNILWWGWFVLVARALWKWLLWRDGWLFATDQRLLLTHGLFTKKVAMMPLSKVTDMSYNRSLQGRLLGYGTFIMESAGQDQALRQVDWVADPDNTYRTICAEIFGVDDLEKGVEDEHDHRFEDGPPPHTPGLYVGYVPPEARTGPTRPADEPDRAHEAKGPQEKDESADLPIRYGRTHQDERESWFQSPDLRESTLGDEDTGPISYRPPTTEEKSWHPAIDKRDQERDRGHGPDPDPDRDRGRDQDRDRGRDQDRNR